MMAAASLMIETFQWFKEGKKDTKQRGMGETAFVNFFKEHKREFPGINGSEFYKKHSLRNSSSGTDTGRL